MAVGRDVLRAITPDEVPLRASPWKLGGLTIGELARRVWAEIGDDEIADRAAALSYYFIFALFPALLFLTTLLGLLPFPELMDRLMDYLGRVLPPDSVSIVQKTLTEIVRGARGGLLSIGALGALWASSNGMTAVITTLNVAYNAQDPRPWWKRKVVALLLTVGFAAFIIVALVLLVFGPQIGETIANTMGLGRIFRIAWGIVQWPVVGVAALTGLALVYYFAPAVKQRWYWVTPGSLFALAAWVAMSLGLRFYVAQFGNYNVTYGSIGGVILLMLWLYLSGVVLLVGAEINSEIERAAARRGAPTAKAPGERRPPTEGGLPAAPAGRPAPAARRESAAHRASRSAPRPYAALYFTGALVGDLLGFVLRLLLGRFIPGRRTRPARAPRRAA